MITSVQNESIKRAAALKEKKFRDAEGLFLIEGLRSVKDAAKLGATIKRVFVTDESVWEGESVLVSDAVMKKISDTETPQSIVAVAEKIPFRAPVSDNVLYLDRVRDAGNLGAIIRTAAAAGFDVVMDGCADVFNPKTVRASMSGVFAANLSLADEGFFAKAKADGYKVFAADMDGEDIFGGISFPEKSVLIIGNEADGIKDELLGLCDRKLSIPMRKIESLNAAVSAAVLMYQIKYNKGEN